jgi:hypothetical protein
MSDGDNYGNAPSERRILSIIYEAEKLVFIYSKLQTISSLQQMQIITSLHITVNTKNWFTESAGGGETLQAIFNKRWI